MELVFSFHPHQAVSLSFLCRVLQASWSASSRQSVSVPYLAVGTRYCIWLFYVGSLGGQAWRTGLLRAEQSQ